MGRKDLGDLIARSSPLVEDVMTTRTDIDNSVFNTMPRPPRIDTRKKTRRLSRFEIWAWSPVISFQVGLTASYAALSYFGITSVIATPPSINATTPEEYGGFWAIALIVGAISAAVGSITRRKWFRRVETMGATLLSLTVGSYAAILTWLALGVGDSDKLAGSAGFTALAIPVIIRMMWLYSQLLRK